MEKLPNGMYFNKGLYNKEEEFLKEKERNMAGIYSNLTQGIIDFSTRMLDEPNLNLTVHLKESELEQLLKELLEPHLEHHKIREIRRDLGKINIGLTKK